MVDPGGRPTAGRSRRAAERIWIWQDRPDRYLAVAAVDHDVIGYGRVNWHQPDEDAPRDAAPRGWYLSGLRVNDDWRGRGVGRELTRHRLDWVARRSHEAWYVANERNEVSRRLHASLGFEEIDRPFSMPGVSFADGAGVLGRVAL